MRKKKKRDFSTGSQTHTGIIIMLSNILSSPPPLPVFFLSVYSVRFLPSSLAFPLHLLPLTHSRFIVPPVYEHSKELHGCCCCCCFLYDPCCSFFTCTHTHTFFFCSARGDWANERVKNTPTFGTAASYPSLHFSLSQSSSTYYPRRHLSKCQQIQIWRSI